jgi:uncharacterized membrane protein
LLLLIGESALAQPSFVYSVGTKSFAGFDSGYSALGINDLGHTVGIFPIDGSLPIHGFIKRDNLVTPFDYPGAYDTTPHGINNAGQIVGSRCSWAAGFLPVCTGFLKAGDIYTSYEYPGARFTYANGINNIGQLVGTYRIQVSVGPNAVQDFDHGLLISAGHLTGFDYPGAYSTAAAGINDASQIVGSYVEIISTWPGFRYRGFIKDGEIFTSIDYPGALFTFVTGINNRGQIVGSYQDRYGYLHGFLKNGDTFTAFDVPGADTLPSGINSLGQIVGDYSPRPVVPTINTLIIGINGLGLPRGTATSLVTKLHDAIAAFNTGEVVTACRDMEAFISHVQALSGKKLTLGLAVDILETAAQIEAMIGCH